MSAFAGLMFCNIFCSLKFKLNVFLQTPDPRDSVDMSYEIPEQQDQPQRAGAAAQDPDPGQGPQALHSPPGQLDLLAPSFPLHQKLRWLQPKLHQGYICYIFHSIFLLVVTLAYKLQFYFYTMILFNSGPRSNRPKLPVAVRWM